MERLKQVIKKYLSLTVIVAAAVLLELATGVMYYASQRIIQKTMERLVEREMNAIDLSIRNQLAQVEVTLDNMAWVVSGKLADPDSMFVTTRQIVEHNPAILGSSISFVPNHYPRKGYWFEPYSARRPDGSIETMQLGSAGHDYTKQEFFTEPIARDGGHWCEPYLDSDGAKAMVTTYGVPVHGPGDEIVAVVDADLSLDWLDGILDEDKVYDSSRRFLVTGAGNLLAGPDDPLFRTVLGQMKADHGQKGYIVLPGNGRGKRHVFFHPVGGMTDWILINVLDDAEVFGSLRRVRLLLLLLTVAGLLFAGFIVYRSSRNLERLRKVNAEKERIGGELRVASRIQQSMLPQRHFRQDEVDICGFQEPAREVGGDLFDYFLRDGKLFFCIGDVSGKGAPSAMLMGVTHALFRSASAHESNPARIMQAINETACQGNESNMFITLFVGVLDLPTGHLRYCNAGHDCPIILGKETESLQAEAHLPVGVFEDVKYAMQERDLVPGSTIFLYTDGLTEAKDSDRQQFGWRRMVDMLASCARRQLTPQQLLETLGDEVRRFVGKAEQSDDLTMLAIRYIPERTESILDETLVLKNDVSQVMQLGLFMKSVAGRLNVGQPLAGQLRLAVEEAVVNVMEYAYPEGSEGDVSVNAISDGESLKVTIVDSGIPFDPTLKEKTDTSLAAEDRQTGGLGILLVRELMDTINYEREEGRNVLTLKKHFKKA